MVDSDLNKYNSADAKTIDQTLGIETKNYGLTKYHIILFIIGFLLNIVALYFAVAQSTASSLINNIVKFSLAINAILICIFSYRLFRVFRDLKFFNRDKAQGSVLHFRYVRFFVMAAAIPAIIIALFSGLTYGRGVQAWLSGQVKEAVNSTSNLGNEIVNQISDSSAADTIAMASDLNQAMNNLNSAPETFRAYLESQAQRRGFVAVYIIRPDGEIISKAERPNNVPKYSQPSEDNFITAKAGDVSFKFDEKEIQTVFKLNALNDAYLYAIRLPKPEQVSILSKAQTTISSYHALEARQANIQLIFGLAYLEIVLLVVLAAAWLGLYSATTISIPVAKLVNAAELVAAGDLAVRIAPERKIHELAQLTDTFNTMTGELQRQQTELHAEREEAVKRSQFINAVIEGVSPGVFTLAQDGIILTANSSAAKFMGRGADELVGQNIQLLYPEFAEFIAKFRLQNNEKMQIELDDGKGERIFEFSASEVGDDLVVTFDDVSALIQGQRQAAWRDVARRIAHEIKNPLTPIQLSAERLTRKFGKQITEDKETFLKLNNTIIRQVSDIGRMVDEFSTFARMPAPKFTIGNICEIARETIFSQKIAFPDIEYVFLCPPEAIKVLMDERMISQAFLNILKNAAEAISQIPPDEDRPEDRKGRIEINMDVDAKNIAITVLDNGIGFPKNNRRSLLEPYVTTREKGTGLGLPIVVRIIEEHGGAISLIDRPDEQQGAGVRITLPLANKNETENNNGI